MPYQYKGGMDYMEKVIICKDDINRALNLWHNNLFKVKIYKEVVTRKVEEENR